MDPGSLWFLATVCGLTAVTVWGLWRSLSPSTRRAIFEPLPNQMTRLASALGLKPTGLRAHGTLAGIEVVLSAPEPGLLALRDGAARLRGLSVRTSVLRRLSRHALPDPIQDLGDEAVSLAFLREPVRTHLLGWMVDHQVTVENGEIRLPIPPRGDDVVQVRALAELLAAICETPNVLSGLCRAVRDPASSHRRRALEILLIRFRPEPETTETCRQMLDDQDPVVARLAGLFVDSETRDHTLHQTAADELADTIQRLSRDMRPAAITRIAQSADHAEAAAVARALLCGRWIEEDAPALDKASAALALHGTPDALPALALQRDRADGLRSGAIVAAIAGIRRRFPDADTGGRLSVAVPPGGELSVAEQPGRLSMARKPDV